MEWVDDWGVRLATFLPLVGAIVLLFLPEQDKLTKTVGTAFATLALIAGALVLFRFEFGDAAAEFQFVLDKEWIPTIGARYHIGLDGMSLPLFVLSLLVSV